MPLLTNLRDLGLVSLFAEEKTYNSWQLYLQDFLGWTHSKDLKPVQGAFL
jgi:hypothetical protein